MTTSKRPGSLPAFALPFPGHAPRKRSIQYSREGSRYVDRFGVLDRPVKPGDDDGEHPPHQFEARFGGEAGHDLIRVS